MKKPIRVALSGSGFKFPAHVGALMAVEAAGYEVVEIAGTSGGSIIAALFACGMQLTDMKDLAMNQDWSDMLTFTPLSLFSDGAICSGSNLHEWLCQNTREMTFSDVQVPLTIMASDINSMQPYEFSTRLSVNTSIGLAARASASIPLLYAPVQYNGAFLQDGGMANNIPIDKLQIDSAPRLGIQLVSKEMPLKSGTHSILEVIMRDLDFMLQSNENAHVDIGRYFGAKFAFVETGFASTLDRNMSLGVRAQLFDNGFETTVEALREISP